MIITTLLCVYSNSECLLGPTIHRVLCGPGEQQGTTQRESRPLGAYTLLGKVDSKQDK